MACAEEQEDQEWMMKRVRHSDIRRRRGAGGRLATRTWSRKDGTNALVTTYSYNDAGEMISIDYSDSTPDVTFTHDRLGRQKTASSSVSAHEFSYNAYLQLESETISATGATYLLTRSYDNLGRASGLSLDSDYAVGYAYDTYGRMNSVSSVVQSASSASSADYSYLPNSDLISGYTMGDLSVTRSYESHRNLLTSIENRFDTNTISRYSYNNDAGGRRVSVVQTGTAFEPVGAMFNLYRYNSRSELTSAERYFGSSTNDTTSPVGLQDWSYAFDNIGNRTGTMKSDASADYTANSLNQYTERTVHGSSDIIGSAEQDVTIEVNGNEADRQGYYWSHRLTVDNLFNPIYTQVVVEAICDPGTNAPYVVSSETGNVFVAASPEEFTYDDEGNLLSDGRFEYQWDCENRLIAATTKDGLPEDMPIVHVEFEYDYMSRRVGKTVYQSPPSLKAETTARSLLRSENAANTNWTQSDARSFLYDGWSLIREEASGATATTNWYIHGLDLSGSLQGAGGIGGLLTSCSSGGTSATSSVFTFDGNGNVSELLSMSGAIVAHYEYSPFGEIIVATGPLAAENPFRFSNKYFCDEFGMGDWGYRWYSPSMGRWMSRDPIAEMGGRNLYAIVRNRSVDRRDPFGLSNDPGDFGWDWYAPDFFPAPPDLTAFQIQNLYQMLSLALQGAQTYILDEQGKVHRKIVEEAKLLVEKEVIAKVKANGCCLSSYTFSEHIGGTHAYGGKLFINPLSAIFTDAQWGPLHYNFYTIGNTHNDIDYNVTVGTSRAMLLFCCYSASASMKGNIVDQFDFVPDRPNSGWKNRAYNALAWVWSSVYNDFMGASRPQVRGAISEQWTIEGCFMDL